MAQHIGKAIRRVINERGMTVAEFARRIKMSRENAYDIFKRETIDTGLLAVISGVLRHEFIAGSKGEESKIEELLKEIEHLKKRVAMLERKIGPRRSKKISE